jgi:hypothetical protein
LLAHTFCSAVRPFESWFAWVAVDAPAVLGQCASVFTSFAQVAIETFCQALQQLQQHQLEQLEALAKDGAPAQAYKVGRGKAWHGMGLMQHTSYQRVAALHCCQVQVMDGQHPGGTGNLLHTFTKISSLTPCHWCRSSKASCPPPSETFCPLL